MVKVIAQQLIYNSQCLGGGGEWEGRGGERMGSSPSSRYSAGTGISSSGSALSLPPSLLPFLPPSLCVSLSPPGRFLPSLGLVAPPTVVSTPGLHLPLGGKHQASLAGRPAYSCLGRRTCWEHWRTQDLADLTSLNVLISFDQLQNKYGPTNCHFYGYLQPRHFVNLRTNISQRKSGS